MNSFRSSKLPDSRRRGKSRRDAPQGPITYRVYFHDGTPVFPRPDEDPTVPLASSPGVGEEIVYRIASWEESELSKAWDEATHHRGRPAARW